MHSTAILGDFSVNELVPEHFVFFLTASKAQILLYFQCSHIKLFLELLFMLYAVSSTCNTICMCEMCERNKTLVEPGT